MEQNDFYIQHCSLCGSIRCAQALTQNAAPNSEYETHTHHVDFEIYWFMEGKLSLALEGQRIGIEPGDMVILCSNLLHRPIISEPCLYHRKRILFHQNIFARLGENGYELQQRLLNKRALKFNAEEVRSAGLDKLFDGIGQALEDQTRYGDFSAQVFLLHLLITAEKTCQWYASGERTPRIGKAQEIIRYIDSHLTGELTYRTIGKHFHISEKSLYKHFRQETGFTLSRYIKERRIIKAKSLLNAGSCAFDAAASAGFQDYSVFFRSFVKAVGCSPAEYVKKQGS